MVATPHKKAIGAIAVLLVVPVVGLSLRACRGGGDRLQAVIRRGPVIEAVYGIGTVTATREHQLRTGVASTIRRVYVREGDEVPAGRPLISLDDSGSTFTAPFAGTVTSAPYRAGEAVFPQMPILVLTDLKERYIAVSLEQKGALRVRRGQRVQVSFEDARHLKIEGKIRTVFPSAAQFLAHVEAALPPEILPGMTADVAIEIARREGALLVPAAALIRSAAKGAAQNAAVRRGGRLVPIRLGAIEGEWAEITSGDVKEGERVELDATTK